MDCSKRMKKIILDNNITFDQVGRKNGDAKAFIDKNRKMFNGRGLYSATTWSGDMVSSLFNALTKIESSDSKEKQNKKISWNEYFIGIAQQTSLKSKDPSTKVGAVIVAKDNTVISLGFNGWVRGCDESQMTWDRPLKYHMVIHAEMNAIMFAKESLEGAKVYCTHAPCDNCLKHMLQKGIREIYFQSDELVSRFDNNMLTAIGRLVAATGTKLIKL